MKNIYLIICFIFICTASFGQESIFSKKEGPQFTMANREIVTTAEMNKTKKITVPFLNDGTEPLIFTNKNSTCLCIATEIPENVKPGEKGDLVIHFTPTRTGNYSETIYIQTNAREIPQLFGFRAMVK